jgi:hypothetical protein
MRPLAFAFGLIMAGNGLLHLIGSLYMKKAMPGLFGDTDIWMITRTPSGQ